MGDDLFGGCMGLNESSGGSMWGLRAHGSGSSV